MSKEPIRPAPASSPPGQHGRYARTVAEIVEHFEQQSSLADAFEGRQSSYLVITDVKKTRFSWHYHGRVLRNGHVLEHDPELEPSEISQPIPAASDHAAWRRFLEKAAGEHLAKCTGVAGRISREQARGYPWKVLKPAAIAGTLVLATWLVYLYTPSLFPKPPADPRQTIQALVAEGDAGRIVAAARDFMQGNDYDSALLLLQEAADRHHSEALFMLAGFYDPLMSDSPFSKPRPHKALEQYRVAAALGHPDASQRLEALRRWLEQAAAGGDAEAARLLNTFGKR